MYRDISTCSQREKDTKEPHTPENKVNGIRFTVHKQTSYKDQWFLSCQELRIEKKNLRTEDMEDAKRKAVIEILISLNMTVERYSRAIEQANQQLTQLTGK